MELVARPRPPLRVAVSACLLGAAVRYDGGSRRAALPHRALAGLFEFRGICPEVEIGMGVPREPIQLVGAPAAPRARGVRNAALDVTDKLSAFAAEVSGTLADVDGYIFMKDSPSCGLFDVEVRSRPGVAAAAVGRGIYSAALTRLLPNLPVEECGRLFDALPRENFITRVFVHAHWRALPGDGLSARTLHAFHNLYEERLRAHSEAECRRLTRLLASLCGSGVAPAVADEYIGAVMQTLALPLSRAAAREARLG